ncbi:hypothetical protein ACTXT7_000884 [Hymenolepis weldensis]
MLIRVRTNENVIFEIADDTVSLIPLLSDTASDSSLFQSVGEIKQDEVIDLNKVSAETLQAVIEWCNYHKICTPGNDNKREGPRSTWQLCQWDRAFFHENRRIHEDIMEAAIILEMDNLSDACSVYNAKLFQDFQEYGESLSFRY